jgi:hypothetical protein
MVLVAISKKNCFKYFKSNKPFWRISNVHFNFISLSVVIRRAMCKLVKNKMIEDSRI